MEAQTEPKCSKKKMYYTVDLEKRLIIAATLKRSTTRRACAAIAITSMDATKNHGIALMISFMQTGCAKIATSIAITVNAGKKRTRELTPVSSRKRNAHDFHTIRIFISNPKPVVLVIQKYQLDRAFSAIDCAPKRFVNSFKLNAKLIRLVFAVDSMPLR